MWRSKAGLIFRRVSRVLNTASTHQKQVVSARPIRLHSSISSHSESFLNPTSITALSIQNNDIPHNSKKLQKNPILESPEIPDPVKKCIEDAENVVLIRKKNLDVEEQERELKTLDLNISGQMIAKVVKTPGFRTDLLIKFFRWAVNQANYLPSSQIMETITVAICSKGGRKGMELLKNLMEEIAEKHSGVITTPALNIFIRYLGHAGRGKEALEVFEKFEDFECVAGTKSYYVTIRELCMASMFDEAFSIVEQMEKAGHFPGKRSIASKLIRLFCKGDRTKQAHMIYLKSKEKGKLPRLVGISALVESLCNVEKTPDVAAEILGDIPRKDRKHALKPYFAVIRTFCNSQEIDKAQELLSQMVKSGPRPDRATYNTIINALSKADRADQALTLLEQMSSGRIRPDIYAYNVIMTSFAKAGRMQEACDLFSKAKEDNIKFHFITYKILIDGFCRLGDPKKAHQYFSELKESGRSPNQEVYSNLVSAYTLQGLDLDMDTAKKLLDEMEKKGISPSLYTQGLVQSAKEMEQEALQAETPREERACRDKKPRRAKM